MDGYLVGLAIFLGFLFGWNNGSFLFGNLRGSGTASIRTAFAISTLGLVLGVLLEGPKMYSGMAGSLTLSTTDAVLLITLVVSVAFTVALTLLSLPVSFSMVMVAAFLGSSLASSISVSVTRSAVVILFWFAAPLVTAVLTFLAYSWSVRFTNRLSILAVDYLNRSGSAASALLVSYTLGANNIGLIYGAAVGTAVVPWGIEIVAAITLAAVAGIAVSTRSGVSGTVGDKMLSLSPQAVFTTFAASAVVVWVGTQFAIPMSISQCLLGGMLGAAYTKNIAVLNRRLVAETMSVWVVAPVLAFLAGYLLILLE
jgi:PiT family inorganic phosphate transporter